MSNDNIQLEDIIGALDKADAAALQHQGQTLGRLRDLGVFCFPGNDADMRPAYLPTTEQWQAMALEVQRNQNEVMRKNHPDAFSKNSGDSAGIVRKIERA